VVIPDSTCFSRLSSHSHAGPVKKSNSLTCGVSLGSLHLRVQELAENGALLLGERLRSSEERRVVADVLARVMMPGVKGAKVCTYQLHIIMMRNNAMRYDGCQAL